MTTGTGSCGTASGSGNTVTLASVALNTGATATITFTTTPTTAGTANATSSVTVPSGWVDSNPGNNTADVSTTLTTPTGIFYRAGTYNYTIDATGATGSVNLTVPGSVAVGDLMVAFVTQRLYDPVAGRLSTDLPVFTAPAGWTQIGATVHRSGTPAVWGALQRVAQAIYYKRNTGAADASPTFTSTRRDLARARTNTTALATRVSPTWV